MTSLERDSARATPARLADTMIAPAVLHGAKVVVVVPAYRVASQIQKVIHGIPGWVHAIVIVEDCSPDETAKQIEACRDPRVVLVRHAVNQGVGGAMATGFREALQLQADIVVKMDGDDQMDPAYLPRLVQPLIDGQADVVKCNRYQHLDALRQMPVVRVIGNAGLTFFVKAASGYWNIFDPANGYIAVRAKVLERLDLSQLPKRYYFESGFLVELGILRAVVRDLPVPARYGDEHSSLSPLRVLCEFPPRLFMGLMRRLFWRYIVHDFSATSLFLLLGVPMLLFGTSYGAYAYWSHIRDNAYASAGVVMIAAMPIILGVQLLLQAVVLDIYNVPREPLCSPLRRAQRDGA